MIMFENVSKRYEDGTVAVNSLNLEIKQGEFFFLSGRVVVEKQQH